MERPLLVILEETGEKRDGLPVLRDHRAPEPYLAVLTRGLSGRLLRVYSLARRYLHMLDGRVPEPAYLLVSRNEGGFPRWGFFLEEQDKRGVGYVDLHENLDLFGRFGALDQIFPHELAHVLMHEFCGSRDPGGSNQIHAVGVRSDPETAFDEGFAEHFQVMAVDDPDAEPSTAALSDDTALLRESEQTAWNYALELFRGHALSDPGLQDTFPWWFSKYEQVLRYGAVKRNAFAREPCEVEVLLEKGALYEAYLVANIVPGRDSDRAKGPGVLVSVEGVVSSLFYRLATSERMRNARPGQAFYGMFGSRSEAVSLTENVYLKMLHAFAVHRPHTVAAAVAAYAAEFPDEAGAVEDVVSQVTLGQGLPTHRPIWLANRAFPVGTSVFDQFRAIPRPHTFDLNAASEVDLRSVPGVDGALAHRITKGGPYGSAGDVARVDGVTPGLLARFLQMESDMAGLGQSPEDMETGFLRDFAAVIQSYRARRG